MIPGEAIDWLLDKGWKPLYVHHPDRIGKMLLMVAKSGIRASAGPRRIAFYRGLRASTKIASFGLESSVLGMTVIDRKAEELYEQRRLRRRLRGVLHGQQLEPVCQRDSRARGVE